uniref:Secreted protein n=1 Tax=Panagrellus redivivus TaxID=6233 RepID=A0A7E4W5Z8_PANRE
MNLLVFVTLLFATGITAEKTSCDYVTLVKCFINILDDWTWTLYELRENVVTINEEQCAHLRQLDKCIQDDGPKPHSCNHNEIVEASNTVSDLLTHRRNSGSFLKSYYLLTYACSPSGQELLATHRSCLSKEQIGEMTLSAGTYLSEKFLEHGDDEVCDKVNEKLNEYMDAVGGLCDEGASLIMCKSLTNMFKGLHADKLQNCDFKCLATETTTSAEEDASPEADQYSQEEAALAGNVNSGNGFSIISASIMLILARAL